MRDVDQICENLSKKLDRQHVKPPAPGKYGDYIEGWFAIAEANRIFGHLGWSYRVDGLTKTNATTDPQGKHHIGYTALVTVSVQDAARQDVGHGQGHGKSEGDAYDSAVKEAVTDALKRALRSFGYPLGLALYDKSKEHVGDIEADKRAEEERAECEFIFDEIMAALTDLPGEELHDFPRHWKAKIDRLKAGAPDLCDRMRNAYKQFLEEHKAKAA